MSRRRNRRDAGNDKRTKKGKVYAGSNGKSRPRKPGGEKGPVDPCRCGVRLLFHRPIVATVARQIPVLKVTCSNHVSVRRLHRTHSICLCARLAQRQRVRFQS